MDTEKNAGIVPQSDSDLDIDIITYSESDDEFETETQAWADEAGKNKGAQWSMLNVPDKSMSCVVENYHGTSSEPSEKQEPEAGHSEIEASNGSGAEVSSGDAPPEKQDIGGGDDASGNEDGVISGDDDPPEKQDVGGGDGTSCFEDEVFLHDDPPEKHDVGGDDTSSSGDELLLEDDPPEDARGGGDISDTDGSDQSFETNMSGDVPRVSGFESASECSPMPDNNVSEEHTTADDIKSDISAEIDIDDISSEDENEGQQRIFWKDGCQYEVQCDSLTGEHALRGVENSTSEYVKRLSCTYMNITKISPNRYKYILGDDQVIYAKSRVKHCKVFLERLLTLVEATQGRGRTGEIFSTGSMLKCGQVGITCDKRSAVLGREDTASDSVSSNSMSESPALLGRSAENNNITCSRKSPGRKYMEGLGDYFQKRNGRFVCKICGVQYVQRAKLKPHINMHTEKYKCAKCDRIFANKRTFKSHVLKHPNTSCSGFVCEICGKGFKQKSNKKTHMTLVHSDERNFVCNICGSRWKRRCDLRRHIREVHEGIKPKVSKPSTGKKRFPCPVCGGMFTELQSHMRKHTGEKPYQCNICERRFAQPNTLVAHQRTHTGERPYKCTQCEKTFTQSSHRLTHMKAIHSAERSYECETCGKTFKLKGNLNAHKETHANWLSIICQICGVGCRSKGLLRKHMRAHILEARFECTDCGVKFRNRDAYRLHMKVHRQEWVYKCDTCDAGFVRKDSYLSHMKKHESFD